MPSSQVSNFLSLIKTKWIMHTKIIFSLKLTLNSSTKVVNLTCRVFQYQVSKLLGIIEHTLTSRNYMGMLGQHLKDEELRDSCSNLKTTFFC